MVSWVLRTLLVGVVVVAVGCGDEVRTPLPCEVEGVVDDKCNACHGSPLDFGAPMPLETWEDVHRRAPTDPREVWLVMEERIGSVTDPMPPAGLPQLTAQDRQILDAWFAAGAPPAGDDETCP